jgi:hypothetical protein
MRSTPDQREWVRKHDDRRDGPYLPEGKLRRHWYPSTADEVVDIVREVAVTEPKPFVRAAGSGWALSEAVCDPLFEYDLVETCGLNTVRTDVVPHCLSREVRSALARQRPGGWDGGQDFNLVHVGAGMRIFELYSLLDRQGPDDGRLPTDELGEGLAGPWALPTMGGAGGQTVAGAFSTSTHGGDQALPPIADAVVAIELIGAGGQRFWVQRPSFSDQIPVPLCDSNCLRGVFGEPPSLPSSHGLEPEPRGVVVINDDDALNAALVAVGRMGVITSVVLKVVRGFGLRQTRTHHDWREIRDQLVDPASDLFRSRFLQVVVNPLPRFNSDDHSCWVEQREAVPIPDELPAPAPGRWLGRAQRSGANAGKQRPVNALPGDLYNTICSGSPAEAMRRMAEIARATAAAVGAGGFLLFPLFPFIPVEVYLGSAAALGAFADRLDKLSTTFVGGLGDLLAELTNEVVAAGNAWLLPLIVEQFIGAGQPEIPASAPAEDFSYAVMDFFDYDDLACITNGDSVEVAFDADTDAPVRFIEDVVFPRAADVLRQNLAFGVYVSMRWTGRTKALLGIQRWDRTCVVEIAGLKRFAGLRPLLDVLEAGAKAMGGTVHWGQRNNLTAAEVAAGYPDLPIWRNQLREFSAFGPAEQFSTRYTQRIGLEP